MPWAMTSRTRTAEREVTTPSPSEPRARITLALLLLVIAAASVYLLGSYAYTPGIVYMCISGDSMITGQVGGGLYPVVFDFTHSVHKTNEKDVLVASDEGFAIGAVALREYGAGTPYTPGDIGGATVIDVGGYTVYMGGRSIGGRVSQSLDLPVYMIVYMGTVSFETGECSSLELVYVP